VKQGPAVSRALHRDCRRHLGTSPEVSDREAPRAGDPAADIETPGLAIDGGNVKVDQQVMQPGGRERIVEGLNRHAVVSGGELQLLHRHAIRFIRHR